MSRDEASRPAGLPLEVIAVWLLFFVVAVEIASTYSRIPAHQLYHVSGGGLAGGASRVLVFLNFPTALVAIAILAVLYERLRTRRLRATAVVAGVLCAVVVWPGVVSEANLDAKPVNALAAIGVLLALVLTVAVARSGGVSRMRRQRGDIARAAIALVLLVLSAPWVGADLGFFLDGVPVLGSIFRTSTPFPDVYPFPPSVHHGHHHGMDGFLLVATVLLLSRLRLGSALRAYLALMLCYGLANLANDFWIEQVWKRGWVSWQIPNVLVPKASVAWAVIVVAAAMTWVATRRTA